MQLQNALGKESVFAATLQPAQLLRSRSEMPLEEAVWTANKTIDAKALPERLVDTYSQSQKWSFRVRHTLQDDALRQLDYTTFIVIVVMAF
jgi:hypothetical protein